MVGTARQPRYPAGGASTAAQPGVGGVATRPQVQPEAVQKE